MSIQINNVDVIDDGKNIVNAVNSNITGISTASSFSGSGANLTSLNASNLASGTVPDARFPATLPAASGANLTSLNASNVSSGTLAIARGGTNSTATATAGGAAYGTGTAFAFTSAGTSGQVLTSNGTSAPTWEDAGGVDALGAIGSYGFFYRTSQPAGSAGDTTAGSNLRYSNAQGTSGSTPSGTWRLHGSMPSGYTNLQPYTSLWIRIS